MWGDSSALSLWLLAAANSWLRVPPFMQALFDMVIIKQPCLLHYFHIGMRRPPQEVEKEEWTVWWEERLGRDERLRAVSQFGRLAQRQRIPFPCQSALSLFWIRLDLHRLMTPEAWAQQRLSAQNQILASWDVFLHDTCAGAWESRLIGAKCEYLRTDWSRNHWKRVSLDLL